MPPILLIALLAVGGYFLLKEPAGSTSKPTEAPKDARDLFATMIAPSMTSIDALRTSWAYLLTAAKNQAAGSVAASRLAQYALVCFLKACMLAKGAQPDPNELAAIGQAPLTGGAGLISYGDASMDQLQAVAAGLAPTYTNLAGLGQYIAAVSSAYQQGGKTKRLLAFLLALKAKQMLLANPVQFTGAVPAVDTTPFQDAQDFPVALPQCLFAIANLPASDVPPSNVNSILSYQ